MATCMRLDAGTGRLEVLVDDDEWSVREPVSIDLADNDWGVGRELFAPFRSAVGRADHGASIFGGCLRWRQSRLNRF